MPKKRRFGRVRKLPSGRYQARYLAPDGTDRPAPHTFASKTDAERWLVGVEAEIVKGTWRDPDLGRVPLGEYLTEWIAHRSGLRPRTVDLYRWLSRKYIEPTLRDHLRTRHHARHSPCLAGRTHCRRNRRDHGRQGVPAVARRT